MPSILVSALAIVAASFAAPIDSPANNLAVRYNGMNQFFFSSVIGGPGGIDFAGPSFSDIAALIQQAELPNITTITISGDKRVNQFAYDIAFPNGSTGHYAYGGRGGNQASIQLEDGEFINEVRIQLGARNSRGPFIRVRAPMYPGESSSGPYDNPFTPVNSMDEFELDTPLEKLAGSLGPTVSEMLPEISSPPSETPNTEVAQFAALGKGNGAALSAENDGFSISRIVTTTGGKVVVAAAVTVGFSVGAAILGITINNIVSGKHGSIRIYYMSIKTNLGTTIEQGELDKSPLTIIQPPPGYTKLVGFLGRSGDEVDAIGPVWG